MPTRPLTVEASHLPRLCFIHIPKTAGSSVRSYFFKIYGSGSFGAYTTDDYAATLGETLVQYRFYAGHAYHRDWSRLPADTRFFTILRDPVSRAVSLYKYWNAIDTTHLERRHGYDEVVKGIQLARTKPIEEFVAAQNGFISEHLHGAFARQLVSEATLRSAPADRLATTAAFAEAINRLFGLYAVMTTERLHLTFPRFLSSLGLPGDGDALGHSNVSEMAIKTDLQRLRAIMAEVSPIDFHIYAVARELEGRLL